MEGLEALLLRWAEEQGGNAGNGGGEAVEELRREQARLAEGLAGVVADVGALREQFAQDSANVAAEMGARVDALAAEVHTMSLFLRSILYIFFKIYLVSSYMLLHICTCVYIC